MRWHYRIFQGAPDLIRELLPGSASAANALGLDTAAAAGAVGCPGGLAGGGTADSPLMIYHA